MATDIITRGDCTDSVRFPGSMGTGRHEEGLDPVATPDELKACTTPADRGDEPQPNVERVYKPVN